jgi:hypothetical protein
MRKRKNSINQFIGEIQRIRRRGYTRGGRSGRGGQWGWMKYDFFITYHDGSLSCLILIPKK